MTPKISELFQKPSLKQQQQAIFTTQEARLLCYANRFKTQRTTCLIFFIGCKIKRGPIQKDVALLQEYGFCLEL